MLSAICQRAFPITWFYGRVCLILLCIAVSTDVAETGCVDAKIHADHHRSYVGNTFGNMPECISPANLVLRSHVV